MTKDARVKRREEKEDNLEICSKCLFEKFVILSEISVPKCPPCVEGLGRCSCPGTKGAVSCHRPSRELHWIQKGAWQEGSRLGLETNNQHPPTHPPSIPLRKRYTSIVFQKNTIIINKCGGGREREREGWDYLKKRCSFED